MPQRLALGMNCVVVLACFAAAIGLIVARELRDNIKAVDITSEQAGDTVATPDGNAAPGETLPAIADPNAKNFLIAGVDNNSCIPPDSPYAGGLGKRSENLSDTIMVIRVDPATKRAAVLSFPRDLWVKIAERNTNGKINSAYKRDEPQRLIATIESNFHVPIDHFIQVDFCAFRTIVNAIGGVSVPFEHPARDKNTGLDVPTTGCYSFDGDSGLAYVRSRHYSYQDETGRWKDGSGDDFGRISRQQDFLRRVLKKALDKGIFDVSVARGLIDAAGKYTVVDEDLTPNKMLEFLGVLRDVEPADLLTYQVEAKGQKISGYDVLIPQYDSPTMQPILALFRGEVDLAPSGEAPVDTTPTAETTPADSTPAGTTPAGTTPAGTTPATSAGTTVPGGVVGDPQQEINRGIVPPADIDCS